MTLILSTIDETLVEFFVFSIFSLLHGLNKL